MRKTLCWILGAAMLAGLAGCNQSEKGTVSALNAEKPARTPFLVEASNPERRDISEYLTETGNITAERQVEVLAKGTGHCMEILVEEGDHVEKDQVLAEIDKAEMQVNIQQSRVNVKHQENIYRRTENGWKQGIFSEAEKDNAKSAFEQAQASLEMQEVQLTYLTIRAPISGVITHRKLQAGMLVSTGMPVFSIVDPSSFILPIFVTERSLPRLKLGQEARVTIDSSGDREFVAKVRRINPGVDAQTGSVKVVLDFDPSDHEYLREAAFARYSLVMDTHTDVLVVPKDAIVEENARRYVMVAQRGAEAAQASEAPAAAQGGTAASPTADTPEWVAARVEVETGLEDSNYTEILSGINDDTLVITLGQQTVNEGDWLQVGNLEETLKTRGEISADAALDEVEKEKAAQEAEAAARAGGRS
jgi:RND family efflux transporter MFP subunit